MSEKEKMITYLVKNTDMRSVFLENLKDSDLEGLYKIIKKNIEKEE